jgi:hypothetical protein
MRTALEGNATASANETATRFAPFGGAGQRLKNAPAELALRPLKAIRHPRFRDQFRIVLPEFSVRFAVATGAKRHEIIEFVGVKVMVEKNEWPLVMDVQLACRAASLASICIAFFRGGALLAPVWSAVMLVPALPSRISISAHKATHEIVSAGCIAEVSFANAAWGLRYVLATLMASDGNLVAFSFPPALKVSVTGHAAKMASLTRGDVLFGLIDDTALLAG